MPLPAALNAAKAANVGATAAKASTAGRILGSIRGSAPYLLMNKAFGAAKTAASFVGKTQRGISRINSLTKSVAHGNFSGISGSMLAADSVDGKSFGDVTSTDETKLLQIIAKASDANHKVLSKILVNTKSINELTENTAKILGIGFKSLLETIGHSNSGNSMNQPKMDEQNQDETKKESSLLEKILMASMMPFGAITAGLKKLFGKKTQKETKIKPKDYAEKLKDEQERRIRENKLNENRGSESKENNSRQAREDKAELDEKIDRELTEKTKNENLEKETDEKSSEKKGKNEKKENRRSNRENGKKNTEKGRSINDRAKTTKNINARPTGINTKPGALRRMGQGIANATKEGIKGAVDSVKNPLKKGQGTAYKTAAFAGAVEIFDYATSDTLDRENFTFGKVAGDLAAAGAIGVGIDASLGFMGSFGGAAAVGASVVGIGLLVVGVGAVLYFAGDRLYKIQKESVNLNNKTLEQARFELLKMIMLDVSQRDPWSNVTDKESLKKLWITNDKELQSFYSNLKNRWDPVNGGRKIQADRDFKNYTSIICDQFISTLTYNGFLSMFLQVFRQTHYQSKGDNKYAFIEWLVAYKELYEKLPAGIPLEFLSEIEGIDNASGVLDNNAYQLLTANLALHETSGLPFKIKPFQLVNNSDGKYSNTPEYKRYKELLTEKNIPYVFNQYKKNPGLYASVVQRSHAQADNTGYETFGQNYGVWSQTNKKNESAYTMNEPEFDNAMIMAAAYGNVYDKEIVLPSTARQAFIEKIKHGSWRSAGDTKEYDWTGSLSQNETRWEADSNDPNDESTNTYQWNNLERTNLNPNINNNSIEANVSNDEITQPVNTKTGNPEPTVEPEPAKETSVQDIQSVRPSTQPEKVPDLSNITVSDPDALTILSRMDKNIAKLANPPPEIKLPDPPKMDGSNII